MPANIETPTQPPAGTTAFYEPMTYDDIIVLKYRHLWPMTI